VRPFSEYLAARDANRAQFATAYPYAVPAFDAAISAFAGLGEQLRTGRDANRRSHVSLAPFFFILGRQAITAFDSLASNQAYASWVALRTGVESALIMGKWVDDTRNADIWENRFVDRKTYQKTYQGAGLRSASLPRSSAIQQALSHINDRYLHPNPQYYFRHLSVEDEPSGDVKIELSFFDDVETVGLGVLSVLHLTAVIQDSLAEMFSQLFVDTPRLDVHLADLEQKGADFRKSAGAARADAEWLLVNVGLWPGAT
jgi:hypothetical protein